MRRRDIVSFMGGATAVWRRLAYAHQKRTDGIPERGLAPRHVQRPSGRHAASGSDIGPRIQVDVGWTDGALRRDRRPMQSY
jgi:hypothetical protein